MTRTRATSIDDYLAALDAGQRTALEKLRKTIRAAAPRAEEYLAYGLAAFRLDGKPLVAIGASEKHCAFYPMDGTTVARFKAELKAYETSTGTIRFDEARPLPPALIRRIVKARVADNAAKSSSVSSATGRRRARRPHDG
jgi:uncharacterized protein YdhG (YjbR/CyaY superfamily)